MSLTVGKDVARPGTYSFEVHNGFDLVEYGGGYPTYHDAERAGQIAYRALHHNGFKHVGEPVKNDYMTMEEILSELDI